MNKEIEDALHMLLHCSLKDTEYETQVEQYKIVRKYITNLQQKNEQLNNILTKLKKWLKETRINSAFIDEQTIMEVQLKIQELEQGSDSNEM